MPTLPFGIEAVIDLLGLEQLTNAVRGWKSVQLAGCPLDELRFYYEGQPVCVTHPSLLIPNQQAVPPSDVSGRIVARPPGHLGLGQTT